jgi:2-succinyl-6-hydroxy-2,4-cyclohexadiene-1-carboxylate synthase
LPGFLGQSAEFERLRGFLAAKGIQDLRTLDLTEFGHVTMHAWADKFVEKYEDNLASRSVGLLGYSMGGRLLLHIAESLRNTKMNHVPLFFVSTNPGLPEATRDERRAHDWRWAERFVNSPWEAVIKDWNSQAVFATGTQSFEKAEKPYSLQFLHWFLTEWSLGNQKDFRAEFAEFKNSMGWITGDRDQKFCEIADSLPQVNNLKRSVVLGAGHRVHLDRPELLAELLI